MLKMTESDVIEHAIRQAKISPHLGKVPDDIPPEWHSVWLNAFLNEIRKLEVQAEQWLTELKNQAEKVGLQLSDQQALKSFETRMGEGRMIGKAKIITNDGWLILSNGSNPANVVPLFALNETPILDELYDIQFNNGHGVFRSSKQGNNIKR